MLRFSLGSLLVLVTVIALSCASVMNPNFLFAAGLRMLLLTSLGGSLIVCALCRGTPQKLAAGFAIFVIGAQFWGWMFTDPLNFNDRLAASIADMHGQAATDSSVTYLASPVQPGTAYPYPYYQPWVSPPQLTVTSTPGSIDYGAMKSIAHSLELMLVGLVGIIVAGTVDRLELQRRLRLAGSQEMANAHE